MTLISIIHALELETKGDLIRRKTKLKSYAGDIYLFESVKRNPYLCLVVEDGQRRQRYFDLTEVKNLQLNIIKPEISYHKLEDEKFIFEE